MFVGLDMENKTRVAFMGHVMGRHQLQATLMKEKCSNLQL